MGPITPLGAVTKGTSSTGGGVLQALTMAAPAADISASSQNRRGTAGVFAVFPAGLLICSGDFMVRAFLSCLQGEC